jgi:hypothetical protein
MIAGSGLLIIIMLILALLLAVLDVALGFGTRRVAFLLPAAVILTIIAVLLVVIGH